MNPTPSRLRRSYVVLALLVVAGVAAAGWYTIARGKPKPGDSAHPSAGHPGQAVAVEVISPQAGGIDRMCVQPGTLEPFEAADLYAKASGFLAELNVDIGSQVKKGDILARISVPEYDKQAQRDRARVKAAEAKIRQMEAHIAAAEAEAKADAAAVKRADAMVRARTAFRKYREKQRVRFEELANKQAIEPRVVDEQEEYFLSAQESENEAKEAVTAAIERVATAKAKIAQAKADLEEAAASLGVATAELERSEVLLNYAVITSPYTGVVTRRSFHVGDFIRSADQGGTTPLLAVERTDVMRVIVQVPDRDVPFVSKGDPAVVEIDALPGVVFQSKGNDVVAISRWAGAEDPTTRTMRVEIDVKNPDGQLRHGMYGRASLTLQPGAANAVRVPSGVILSRDPSGKGKVRVVRGDRVQTLPVVLGVDNGVEVEVLAGLATTDQIVVRSSAPVDDGSPVTVSGAEVADDAGH